MLGSLAFALLAGELAFRALGLTGYHAPRTRGWGRALATGSNRDTTLSVQFKPYSVVEYNYESNPRGYFNERNGLVYEMNMYGFRGPDFPMHKPPGTKRILVLGDSFTFGEGVKWQDTFCMRLQARLRQDLGQGIEVLNFGMCAWDTCDEISFYRHGGALFEPDLTVVVFVLNDAEHAGELDFFEDFRHRYEKYGLRHSYLASSVYAAIAKRTRARRYIRSLVEESLLEKGKWDRSFERLSAGSSLAQQIGSEYLTVVFPFMYELTDRYPFAPVHRMIHDYCAQAGIPVFDLFDTFKGRRYTDLWVHPTDQHPNEIGHRIAAEAMASYIEANFSQSLAQSATPPPAAQSMTPPPAADGRPHR